MVCDQTNGYIIHRIDLILLAGHLADLVADSLHRINVKNGINILHNNRKTLQSHTGINILLSQLGVTTLAVSLKLCKYIVPYFHEAVTVTAYLAIRLAASVFFSTVVIDLGTRSARSCSMLPEVITLSGLRITIKACNTVSRHTDFLCPDIVCLIILSVDGRIQTILLQSENLC